MITRRAPLKRTPLKRRAPKRKPGMVDKDFCQYVRERGCVISEFGNTDHSMHHKCDSEITIHHVRKYGGPKDDRRILGLCKSGHLHDFGPHSIERGKAQFERWWGLNIDQTARRLYLEYLGGDDV